MSKSANWGALDVTKFICVLMMVFVHCVFALLTDADEAVDVGNRVFPWLAHLTVLGLFPLCVPATAGAGLRLAAPDLKTILRASLLLGGLGFLMNYLAWGLGEAFQWDALQFIGLCFLLLTLLRRAPGAIYALAIAVLLVTPWLRGRLGGDGLVATLLVGSPKGDGYWPFFPWYFTVAFGYFLADLRQRVGSAEALTTITGLGGLALAGVSLATGNFLITLDADHLWGPAVFQPNRLFVLGLCGFFALCLTAGGWIAERMEFSRYGLVNSFSKGVLWIYLFHVSLADHLGVYFRKWMPLEAGVIVFPGVMALLCWGVGAGSLYLAGKRVRVVLARA